MSTKTGPDSTEAPDFDDDEYVAQLLAKDARDSSKRYSTLGMNAFLPIKRSTTDAPKPNTRFLKSILRETDSHNASLKRKEEREARERMRALRHGHGRSSGVKPERSLYDVRAAKRRRVEASSDEKHERGEDFKRLKGKEYDRKHTLRDREKARESRRRSRGYEESGDVEEKSGGHKSSRSKHHKKEDDRSQRSSDSRRQAEHRRSSEKYRSSDDDRERRSHCRKHRRSHSGSPSRTRCHSSENPNPRKGRLKDPGESYDEHHGLRKHRTSTTSREKLAATNSEKSPPLRQTSKLEGTSEPLHQSRYFDSLDPSGSDSDPLENLIGPLPPSAANDSPPLRSRGRGVYNMNKSNIDAHFASGYDPALDVQPDDDNGDDYGNTANPKKSTRRRPVAGLATGEDDDWDMALEALRDRALWRRKGADRLREAGFDEGLVEKWAGNGAFAGLDGDRGHIDMSRDRDKDVENVKWAKKGEKREWDRGKVLTDDGHIDVKPEW
ncbi:hypothetical protein AJ78_02391 [Emergomyces pasteurianus Ep9510]|uniref:Pre-mRNA-splicing factor 38B n=1 Tax=Emergomyces pasteurianus Ep9510 TaxID=1447872 RepID=A0A1J9PNQ6_9EURO|nr:hypothetical protein AJ78_02391 [Emergomyces pasteurianus Ep9510]